MVPRRPGIRVSTLAGTRNQGRRAHAVSLADWLAGALTRERVARPSPVEGALGYNDAPVSTLILTVPAVGSGMSRSTSSSCPFGREITTARIFFGMLPSCSSR